jgi:hypothetical protein
MKRGATSHPKTLDLAAYLELDRWGAVGILESLFHWTGLYARRGDVGRFTDKQIAQGIGWSGDPAKLIGALAATGWLDSCDCHRWRLHDWPDHCGAEVRIYLQQAELKFAECYPPHTPVSPRRDPIPPAIRREVYSRDGGACIKCGSTENLNVDHVVPVVAGGKPTLDNLQLLCWPCNRKKGGKCEPALDGSDI